MPYVARRVRAARRKMLELGTIPVVDDLLCRAQQKLLIDIAAKSIPVVPSHLRCNSEAVVAACPILAHDQRRYGEQSELYEASHVDLKLTEKTS